MKKITFDINNKDKIKDVIFNIQSTKNITKIKSLVKELQSLTKDYPVCKICGEPLCYPLMYFNINRKNELSITTPVKFEHNYDNKIYKLEKCYSCIKEHFKDDMPSMQRYLFQIRYRWAKWIYDIPEDVHKQIRSDKCGVTLTALINKWGKEEGKKRWEEYCKKQALTNTFEYKQEKYGWTKEQFDEFNQSRACTLENFIKRYGKEIGEQKWQEYLDKQHETKTWEYMVEKFGEEKALEINSQKALNLETFIRKYGKELGKVKWDEYVKITHFGYSKISQKLFNSINEKIKHKYTNIWYATSKNGEYKIKNINVHKTYLLDFYIPELKICIEFDGDLWHANPIIYKPNDIPVPYSNLTAQEIWQQDKERQQFIESQGIKLVRIWESEYSSKEFDLDKFIKEKMGIELDN